MTSDSAMLWENATEFCQSQHSQGWQFNILLACIKHYGQKILLGSTQQSNLDYRLVCNKSYCYVKHQPVTTFSQPGFNIFAQSCKCTFPAQEIGR